MRNLLMQQELSNLSFPAISNIGVADIVVTKQFKQPYIGNIQIISPTGPYVISASVVSDIAGNNNFLLIITNLLI